MTKVDIKPEWAQALSMALNTQTALLPARISQHLLIMESAILQAFEKERQRDEKAQAKKQAD